MSVGTLRFIGRWESLAMRPLYLVDCSLHLERATSRISVLTASIFSAIIGSSNALLRFGLGVRSACGAIRPALQARTQFTPPNPSQAPAPPTCPYLSFLLSTSRMPQGWRARIFSTSLSQALYWSRFSFSCVDVFSCRTG